MNNDGNEKITVMTDIDATLDKVWDCWTKPEHITKWNAASEDWHTPYAENDLRTGGSFMSRMEAKDKSFGFDFKGFYDEVVEKSFISYKMENGRQVDITFEKSGEIVRVTETFDPEKENSMELQKMGWQSILDNFKKYVESQ